MSDSEEELLEEEAVELARARDRDASANTRMLPVALASHANIVAATAPLISDLMTDDIKAQERKIRQIERHSEKKCFKRDI